ncbi:MAG: sulfite exporter TauE/SafE family protein, partial [Betaproteobacteria bacterium]|nr:sulfite exporter TauE/SafE family protein [Betaproteobacteria bacterium]
LLIGAIGVFAIGVLNGSLSSGSGLVLTLWQIKWFGLDYKRATAHTLALCGLLWNGTGALVLGTLGEVAWAWIPALLIGSFVGGYLGSHYAIGKSNAWIKRVFEIVTLAVGVKLLS